MTEDLASTASDRIFIRDLLIRCVIGVDEHERQEKQDVVVQITLHLDLRKAGRTDELTDSVDYSALKKQILRAAEDSHYRLIEALAQRIAEECLKEGAVTCAEVIVEKPGALRFARTVGVQIVRRKNPAGSFQ